MSQTLSTVPIMQLAFCDGESISHAVTLYLEGIIGVKVMFQNIPVHKP